MQKRTKEMIFAGVIILASLFVPSQTTFAQINPEVPGHNVQYKALGRLKFNGQKCKKLFVNGVEHKKYYDDGKLVFTALYTTTFHIDKNNTVSYDLPHGEKLIDFLPPVPAKAGYIFAGWRSDDSANATVYTNSNTPTITGEANYYAVFKKDITITYKTGGADLKGSSTIIYNNGNNYVPYVTPKNFTSGYGTLLGYRTDTATTATVDYSTSHGYQFTDNTTLYAVFKKHQDLTKNITVNMTANGNGGTISPASDSASVTTHWTYDEITNAGNINAKTTINSSKPNQTLSGNWTFTGTRNDHTFLGIGNGETSGSYSAIVNYNSNNRSVSYTAQWKHNKGWYGKTDYENTVWQCYDSNGELRKGFISPHSDGNDVATGTDVVWNNNTYYCDENGYMKWGWFKIENKWYYGELPNNNVVTGAHYTGWRYIDKKYYYFNPDLSMATGWIDVGGKWFYLTTYNDAVTWGGDYQEGQMLASTYLDYNGKRYYFDKDGVCTNP